MTTQPQQFWSEADRRWLRTLFDTQYRPFHEHYDAVQQQWVFFRWVERSDSPSAQQAGPAGYFRGEGPSIEGTYNLLNPAPNSNYERLDRSYYVRHKDFFCPGKVFSVLFTEGAGNTASVQNYKRDAITVVMFGEMAHTQIRRFIVVYQKREFCYALPIFTYGKQGTMKPGVVPKEHAIAYSYGYQAALLQGEAELEKDPICIVSTDGGPLSVASRIYFGIHHPIQYNVKVKDLGYVVPNDVPKLTQYWAMENGVITNQGPEAGG